VVSASGGEAPDPGSPRGEGSTTTKKNTNTTTTTSKSRGDSGCPPRRFITARHASRTAVVSSPELLEHVLTFLAGSGEEERQDVGHAASVCRSWREAAVGEELWGPVASELMPAMERRASELGARRCVLERGLCHRDQRAWVDRRWWYGLRLQVEVWHGLDRMRLLSAEGEMSLIHRPHEISIAGPDRVEVVGPAFSAASRDQGMYYQFVSIDDYFRRGDDGGIIVRVWVRDALRGRQALLWSTGYERAELFCDDDLYPADPLRPYLPEGSRLVTQTNDLPIYSLALPGQALKAFFQFYVRPEAGQEGVAEADKLWRAAGGDEDSYINHPSFFCLRFDDDATEAQIASLIIRGLLDP
jgi:hypothetical protein